MKSGLAIYDILKNDFYVSALVSNRIFPNVAKNSTTFPFIIYDVESESPTQDKDGVSTLDEDFVMVSCYCKTYSEASDLARKIRTALDRKSGSYGGLDIQSIQYNGYNDTFDDNTSDEGVYRKALDFKIRVINIIPSVFSNTYSLEFDGVDDYLSLGDSDVFTPNNSGANRGFSISFWIKLSNKSQQIFSKNIAGNVEYDCNVRFNGNLRLTLYSSDSDSIFQRLNIDTDISDGNWHHIVYTFDLGNTSSSIVGYLDGVQKTNGSGATYDSQGTWVSVSNTGADLRLAYANGSYGESLQDEFSIFDDVLTSSQVTDIYDLGDPNDLSIINYLIGWWRMGDPTGTASYPKITDQSTNNNDATMENMSSSDITTIVP